MPIAAATISPRARAAAVLTGHPMLVAVGLGAASAAGFAPLSMWPLTLAALAVLIGLIALAPTGRAAFALGWAFGAGQFGLSLNWVATAFTFQAAMPAWLGWVAVLLLAAYLALFPALAALAAWVLAAAGTRPRLLVVALAGGWIVTEWLRSVLLTGFAWNPLSAAAVNVDLALTAWIGSYGLSGVIVLAAGALWLVSQRQFVTAVLWAALIGAAAAWAAHRALPLLMRDNPPALTVVQPGIGQADKWEGVKAAENFAKLAALTRPMSDAPRLIFWPEAAIPDYLESGYPLAYYDTAPAVMRARLAALMGPADQLLLGALSLELADDGRVLGARNAVMLVRGDGTLGGRVDKAHLLPFGEYLPARPLLSRLGLSRLAPGDLDFWPGPGPRALNLGAAGRAGIQICYEIVFSGRVIDRANRPDFLFSPSNDAWFGAWGPPQHLAQAQLRAAEEGVPVIRSTPTGISAVIDARGQVVQAVPLGAAGRIDMRLPAATAPTLFARHGNRLPLALAALLLISTLALRAARR